MRSPPYRAETWTDSRQDVRPSQIHGMGIFASATIHRGEVVEIFGGTPMDEAEFRAFQRATARYNAVQIGEDLHLVELPEVTQRRRGSLNHACDSNLWMADEVTLVARREIAPDQELTVDYSLFSTQEDWVMDTPCRCKMPECRRILSGNDWKRKEVQDRYLFHFSPFLNARIDRWRTDKDRIHIR